MDGDGNVSLDDFRKMLDSNNTRTDAGRKAVSSPQPIAMQSNANQTEE